MPNKVIQEERTSYKTLLLRKNREMRTWELCFFLVAFLFILFLFEPRTPAFVVSTILAAIVTLVGVPYAYAQIKHPRYVLTSAELIIYFGNKEERYPLTQIGRTYDFPYFLYLNGKKRPLLVRNEFLEQLFDELDRLNQKNKSKKR